MQALNDLTRQEWASMSTKVTQDSYNLLWNDYMECYNVISEAFGLLKADYSRAAIKEARRKLEEKLNECNRTYCLEPDEEDRFVESSVETVVG